MPEPLVEPPGPGPVVGELGTSPSPDVLDPATRSRSLAGGEREFVSSDGAALDFTRATPDEALLRWTPSGGEEVLFRAPAGSALRAAPGVGGRPRRTTNEIGCSEEPCSTDHQVLVWLKDAPVSEAHVGRRKPERRVGRHGFERSRERPNQASEDPR